MRPLHKSLLLAGLHLVLVASLGAKLLMDRAARPRFWLKAAPVDPEMPIRGRYVDLRVEVPLRGWVPPAKPTAKELKAKPWLDGSERQFAQVKLQNSGGRLWAEYFKSPGDIWSYRRGGDGSGTVTGWVRESVPANWVIVLDDSLPFFIPEHVPDPSLRKPGEELWVEVTLPRKGPLRPIRLAVKDAKKFTLL